MRKEEQLDDQKQHRDVGDDANQPTQCELVMTLGQRQKGDLSPGLSASFDEDEEILCKGSQTRDALFSPCVRRTNKKKARSPERLLMSD